MEKLLQNKLLLIGLVLIVIVGIGAFFLFSQNKQTVPEDSIQVTKVENLSPETIGLKLALSPDNKRVKFSADKLEGVKRLEWEFSYDADIPSGEGGEEGGKVTQSFGGEADINNSSYESVFREIGTCSTGGKCRFDTGVAKIDILLKVTKTDHKLYQVKDSISL